MKKLPFKPTALRKPTLPRLASSEDDCKDGVDSDGLALFKRAKEMEPIMAADRERKARKKQKLDEQRRLLLAKRLRQDDEVSLDDGPLDEAPFDEPHDSRQGSPERPSCARDHSTPAVDLSRPGEGEEGFRELVTPPASKRSRTESMPSKISSLDSDEANLVAADSPSKRRSPPQLPIPTNRPQEMATLSPSTRRGRSQSHLATPSRISQAALAAPTSAQAIPLDSDSDDDDDDSDDNFQALDSPSLHRRSGAGLINCVSTPSALPAEDEEFSEYVRRAEEQRARDNALLEGGSDPNKRPETVDILITSTVPNAGPCRIKYLFDKHLKRVRDNWVAMQRRNGVSELPEYDDDVILTWRRRKVYMFSTLLSLGIRPSGDGRIQVDGRRREGLNESRNRVHMEAWTPELFHEMELQEELRRKREAGELSDSDDGPGDRAGDAASSTPEPEVRIRVILKARGLDDVKLTVRPETTVETLVVGFRTQRGIGSDKHVSVVFEGERLEEHITMEDAEISDLDLIDVHVK